MWNVECGMEEEVELGGKIGICRVIFHPTAIWLLL